MCLSSILCKCYVLTQLTTKHHAASSSSPLRGMAQRISKKVKPMGRDKGSLIGQKRRGK